MSFRFTVPIMTGLALVPALAFAQKPPASAPSLQERLDAIEKAIDSGRQGLHIPGVSLVIVKDDKVIFKKGFGLRDVERSLPVDSETLFSIGSSTKAFTAMTVMMSEEEKKLALTDSPHKYLSYFKLKDPEADAKITLSDLLCHRSGLDRIDLPWFSGRLSSKETIQVASFAKPTAKFGEKFQYQNIMFLAAGEIVGQVQHRPWTQFVENRIFKPLGMVSTHANLQLMRSSADSSLGYNYDEDKKKIVNLPYRDIKTISPAGAIVSNSTDMAQWLRLMLGKGTFEGKRLVSEASYEKLTTAHQNVAGDINYGYGWFLRDWNGHKVVEHGGNIDGFNAAVALMPDEHLGFVLLTNVSASPLGAQAMEIIWDNLVDIPKGKVEKATVALNPEKEVGSYLLQPIKLQVDVTFKDGKLYAFPKGQVNLPLIPRGGRRYETGPPAPPKIFVTFRQVKDRPEETEAVLEQAGQSFVGGRIDSNKSTTMPKFDAGITIDDLMTRVIIAAGGEEAFKKHRSLKFTSVTELLNQGMKVDETICMQAPNSVSKRQYLQAVGKKVGYLHGYFNGKAGGLESDFTPSTTTPPDKIAESVASGDFYRELNWKKIYTSITITRKEKIGEEEVYVVEEIAGKDAAIREYYSASSFRLLRRATSIVAPGAGLVESIENYSDFRKVDGIEIPFKRTGSQVGLGEFITTITDLKFNVRIADSEFRKK